LLLCFQQETKKPNAHHIHLRKKYISNKTKATSHCELSALSIHRPPTCYWAWFYGNQNILSSYFNFFSPSLPQVHT